jgi:hypothetical protein
MSVVTSANQAKKNGEDFAAIRSRLMRASDLHRDGTAADHELQLRVS